MKVVMIAYHFPPDRAVGAVRAGKVARALVDAGHDVHVIAARLVEPAGRELPGIVVHRMRGLPNARDILAFLRAKTGTRRAAPAEPGRAKSRATAESAAAVIKRHILSLLYVPDDRSGFIVPAGRTAARIVRTGDAIIYSTAPPFSVHLAGWAASRLSGAPWLAEYRDPWELDSRPADLRSRPADRAVAWLRERCVLAPDAVVAASEFVATRLSVERARVGGSPAETIRNGIDFQAATSGIRGEPGFRIGYFGELYVGRDPRPFLGALAMLRRQGMLPADVSVHFYGNCTHYYDVSVAESAASLGVGDLVHLHAGLPRNEYFATMASCALMLLFAQQQPLQVPNKLYDYLAVRRPILAVADPGGETDQMLRELGGHYVVGGNDEAAIATALRAAFTAPQSTAAPNSDLLREWSTPHQMQKLVRYIESLRTRTERDRRGQLPLQASPPE